MMNANSKNIDILGDHSQEIDTKIDSTTNALNTNVATSQKSVETSETMAVKINEIIAKVSEMSTLSEHNQNEIKQVASIANDLYLSATNLNAQLGHFKS